MPVFLFSFTIKTDSSNLAKSIRSSVLELEGAPSTYEAFKDIQTTLAASYGNESAVVVSWNELPAADTYPDDGPYEYVITYLGDMGAGSSLNGSVQLFRNEPVLTTDDVRGIEEFLRAENMIAAVHVVSCRAVTSAVVPSDQPTL